MVLVRTKKEMLTVVAEQPRRLDVSRTAYWSAGLTIRAAWAHRSQTGAKELRRTYLQAGVSGIVAGGSPATTIPSRPRGFRKIHAKQTPTPGERGPTPCVVCFSLGLCLLRSVGILLAAEQA